MGADLELGVALEEQDVDNRQLADISVPFKLLS